MLNLIDNSLKYWMVLIFFLCLLINVRLSSSCTEIMKLEAKRDPARFSEKRLIQPWKQASNKNKFWGCQIVENPSSLQHFCF